MPGRHDLLQHFPRPFIYSALQSIGDFFGVQRQESPADDAGENLGSFGSASQSPRSPKQTVDGAVPLTAGLRHEESAVTEGDRRRGCPSRQARVTTGLPLPGFCDASVPRPPRGQPPCGSSSPSGERSTACRERWRRPRPHRRAALVLRRRLLHTALERGRGEGRRVRQAAPPRRPASGFHRRGGCGRRRRVRLRLRVDHPPALPHGPLLSAGRRGPRRAADARLVVRRLRGGRTCRPARRARQWARRRSAGRGHRRCPRRSLVAAHLRTGAPLSRVACTHSPPLSRASLCSIRYAFPATEED